MAAIDLLEKKDYVMPIPWSNLSIAQMLSLTYMGPCAPLPVLNFILLFHLPF